VVAAAREGSRGRAPGARGRRRRLKERELPRVVRRTSDRRRVEDWSFVLRALGVIHEIREEESGFGIAVLPEDEAEAASAIDAHEAERAEPQAPAPEYGPSGVGWMFAAFIVALELATGPRDETVVWFAKGSADAERILHGEWFRVVTALSLHADVSHVLGNDMVGGLLLSALGRRIGTAAAAWIALVSGAAGNALTAAVARHAYTSVGASTAVFGVLAALAMVQALSHKRAAAVALGSGAALLGFLGTGQNADLLAHLFGFCAGGLAALATRRLVENPPPRTAWQPVLGAATLAVVGAAWWVALRSASSAGGP
jgi:rhomboid protease GluP